MPSSLPMFDCAQIHSLNVHMQENLRAGAMMIYCGESQGGSPDPTAGESMSLAQEILAPLLGGTDADLITGADQERTLSSRRHTRRLIRITRMRSSSPTTIHAASPPTRSTSPARRSPPTAARPSPASPGPTAKAHSATLLATPLFYTIALPPPGSRSGLISAAAVRA